MVDVPSYAGGARDARRTNQGRGAGYYHIMSRVVARRMVFNDAEKERFRQIMRAAEEFSGIEILTHTTLSNHFHILLYVPEREKVSDELFVLRFGALYDRGQTASVTAELHRLREAGQHEEAEALKSRYTYRMYDLSEFAKTLKQRITTSYNGRHRRKGTLWEERFKSVLIEGNANALAKVASYIDLNAVRAGIVRDPKDYRFCGYGEAMGGSTHARRGLCHVMRTLTRDPGWSPASKDYRKLLYIIGEQRGISKTWTPLKPGFRSQAVEVVIEAGGSLAINELLRCRVRYFTDGAVPGSKAFVEDVFQRHRLRFSPKRRTGARPMVGGQWGDLCTIRRLRLEVITPPAVC